MAGTGGFIYVHYGLNHQVLVNLDCTVHMMFWYLRQEASLPKDTVLTELDLADQDGNLMRTNMRHNERGDGLGVLKSRGRYVLMQLRPRPPSPLDGSPALAGEKYLFTPLLKNVKEVFPNFILESERRAESSRTRPGSQQSSDESGRSSAWGKVKKKTKQMSQASHLASTSGKSSAKGKSRAK